MNYKDQRPTTSQRPFWKRILERHRFRGRLLPVRAPLVFFRFGWLRDSRRTRAGLGTIAQNRLAVHVHLPWPQWLSNVPERRVMIEKSSFAHSMIRQLKTEFGTKH